jgi:hypothetical protein
MHKQVTFPESGFVFFEPVVTSAILTQDGTLS